MNEINRTSYDVAVVGAGPAGLQAALTLGRMHRRVVLIGTDRCRNDAAAHMHNFLGHDTTSPAELRAAGRADLERYDTVTVLEREVTEVGGDIGEFTLETDDGSVLTARRLILATGVTDELPDVPGLEDLWGDVVAHCPYCHGHEFSGTPVGILGSAAHVPHVAALIERIATHVVVFTHGDQLDEDTAAALKRMGREVRSEPVAGVCRGSLGLTVELEGGDRVDLGGLFVHPEWRLATSFAEQLGLDVSEVGAVSVDATGRTSRDGVFAAGDMAHPPGLPMPMASVLTAAAGGLVAAATCDRDLVTADHNLPG